MPRPVGGQQASAASEERSGGRGDGLLAGLLRDARYAFRRLLARPGFTATALLSLALGVGANAAMFTLVNDVILRKPSLESPERLVDIYISARGGAFNTLSHPDLEDLTRETTDVFSGVAGTRFAFAPRNDGDVPEQVVIELVTANFFEVLGLRPGIGRLIEPADAPAPGTGPVVVLTDAYWRRAFGGDRNVVGRSIRLTGGSYTVIGVTPRDYPGSLRGVGTDLFAPVMMARQLEPATRDPFTDRNSQSTFAKARLRPGATHEQARLALVRLAADLKAGRVGSWRGDDRFTMIPYSDVIIWPPIDRVLVPVAWMLMVVVGLVLVIACANLAAFLLARAVDRRKEIAVRIALGATRGRLVSQLLVESVLLAVLGGALGVMAGRAALRLLLTADLPLPIPVSFDLALDWRVVGFAVAVSVAAGVLFGLAPALQATRFDVVSVIRDESGGGGRIRGRLRQVLVAGQVAVSVVLLVAAGLFVRSLDAARGVDPGFGQSPGALAWIDLPASRSRSEVALTIRQVEQRVSELPGVVAVGAVSNMHLNPLSSASATLLIDEVPPPPGRDGHDVDDVAADTGFIAAAGLRLESGRNFVATDTAGAPPVALVNRAFVERFWPGREAVGRQLRRPGQGGQAIEVVGVVNTAKIRSLAEDPRPAVYFALDQSEVETVWLVARTSGDAEPIVASMLRVIREIDPDLFLLQSRSMKRHLEIMSLPIKLGALALAAFAGLALVMASIGLYGTVSYAVAQRTREVGIRLSLGADRGAVVRLLLWGGLRLVLIGAAAGLALSLALAQLLQGLLFGIRALDPATFAAVPVVLVTVAFLAAWVPARRAGRVNPVAALKAE